MPCWIQVTYTPYKEMSSLSIPYTTKWLIVIGALLKKTKSEQLNAKNVRDVR